MTLDSKSWLLVCATTSWVQTQLTKAKPILLSVEKAAAWMRIQSAGPAGVRRPRPGCPSDAGTNVLPYGETTQSIRAVTAPWTEVRITIAPKSAPWDSLIRGLAPIYLLLYLRKAKSDSRYNSSINVCRQCLNIPLRVFVKSKHFTSFLVFYCATKRILRTPC